MRIRLIVAVLLAIVCISCAHAASKDAKSEWKLIGPFAVMPNRMQVDPSDPHRVYCMSGTLLYRSDDAGKTWRWVARRNAWGQPFDVGADGTVYTGGQTLTASADHGVTWRELSVPDKDYVASLAAATPGVLIMLTAHGMYRSSDGGQSWAVARPGQWYNDAPIVVHPRNRKLIYAIQPAGLQGSALLRSTDAGLTWDETSPVPTLGFVAALAPDPSDPNTIYCTTSDGLAKSTDMGGTWTKVRQGDEFWHTAHALAFDPAAPQTIYAQTNTGLAISHDGGRTWAHPSNPYLHQAYHTSIVASGSTVLAATGSAMLRSTDRGTTWRVANTGFNRASIRAISMDYVKPGLLYVATNLALLEQLRTVDGGRTWTEITGCVSNDLVTLPSRPGYVMGLAGAHSCISEDGGVTWSEHPMPDCRSNVRYAADLTRPGRLLVGCGDRLSITEDYGTTWSSHEVPAEPRWYVSSVAVGTDGAILVGESESALYDILYGGYPSHEPVAIDLRVYRSTDDGKTWTGGQSGRGVTRLAVGPKDPKVIYAGGQAGATRSTFFKSTDGGKTWIYHEDSPIRAQVTSIVIDPTDTKRLYVAAGDSIFVSSDAGNSWAKSNEGMASAEHMSVSSLAIDPFDHRHVYAATSSGLYERRY